MGKLQNAWNALTTTEKEAVSFSDTTEPDAYLWKKMGTGNKTNNLSPLTQAQTLELSLIHI